ncbi:MAG: hypothetical protein ACI82F_004250 [Planctomycetota bacterium]|jgi:hypothetical protein
MRMPKLEPSGPEAKISPMPRAHTPCTVLPPTSADSYTEPHPGDSPKPGFKPYNWEGVFRALTNRQRQR